MAGKTTNKRQEIIAVSDDAEYFGGNDSDYIDITGEGNHIEGGNGMDVLRAVGGHNTLVGGNGNDWLGAFSERLGPPTENQLDGGRGEDAFYTFGVFGSGVFGVGAWMTGGQGMDRFVLRQNSDVLTANLDSFGRPVVTEGDTIRGVFDVITDYTVGERLDLGVDTLRTDPVALSHQWPGHSHLVLNDDEYAFIRGDFDGASTFTVNEFGADLLIVFDNDPVEEFYFEYNGSVILTGVTDPAMVSITAVGT